MYLKGLESLSFLRRKSREEKEFERKLRLREAMARLEKYVHDSSKISREYHTQAVEARRLGNISLTKRFASKKLVLDKRITRAKTFRLVIKDLELSREQTGLLKVFVDITTDFSKTLSEAEPTAKMASEIKRNVESSVAKANKIDIVLAEVLDSISDTLLRVEGVEEEEIEALMESIEAEAAEVEREKVRTKVEEKADRTRDVTAEKSSKPREVKNAKESDIDRRIGNSLDKLKNLKEK